MASKAVSTKAVSAAPAPARREVVSLDALAKQRRDAQPEPTVFDLHGVEFELPPMKLLPMEMQEQVDGGMSNYAGIMKALLGDDVLKAMYAAGYTFDDLELVMEEWQKRSGLEPGESEAS